MAAEPVAHRTGGERQRDPPQAVRAGGPRPLETVRTMAEAKFPDLQAHPEACRFQHRPLRGEDLLGARLGQQPEHHERVGHRLQAEPHDRERAPRPGRGQRSRQGTQIGLRILHTPQLSSEA